MGIGVDYKEGDEREKNVNEWKKYDIVEKPETIGLYSDEIQINFESLKSEYVTKFKSWSNKK